MSNQVDDLIESLETEAEIDRDPDDSPEIGIVMGSDSDLPTMLTGGSRPGAYDALVDELGFGELTDYDNPPDERFTFESYVISAHRTPSLMYTYAETAAARGIEVIIAGAGGKSADLPNMTASIAYPLPVIGVPVDEKSVDSVIGMPVGAPIVAVDAGKSFNAALFAVQLLTGRYPELHERLEAFHEAQSTNVAEVSRELFGLGATGFHDRY